MRTLTLIPRAGMATFLFALLCQACTSPSATAPGTIERFSWDWEFHLGGADCQQPFELDSSVPGNDWEAVDLPHTARIEPLLVNEQWQGSCWYRKEFSYDPSWEGRLVQLRFEGAMNTAGVWINGQKTAMHAGGYLPFTVDITERLKKAQPNVIHVRLNNEDNPLTGPKPLEILDFNMYGGLYRDVHLITKTPVHITDEQLWDRKGSGGVFVHFPKVSQAQARVEVRVHLANCSQSDEEVNLTLELKRQGITVASALAETGIARASEKVVTSILEVEGPQLWSPGSPALYELEILLSDGEHILEQKELRIGIRKFEFRENRLYINGEEHFLRGVNRHQEYPYVGYALSDNAQWRDALKIKEAGFDYVRLSHYPQSPAFLDACDELGLVTINPILGWQFYNPDQRFRQQVYADARALVRRDRNHACVLAWELSLNESGMPHELIDTLLMIAAEEFPTEACYTAGWMEYGYDIYLQARQHRIGHSAHFPDKPYLVSEYGDWEYYAMNAGLNQDAWENLIPEERSSRQLLGESDIRLLQQALNVQEAHNDNLGTPAIGDGYWVMFDYNRGYADDLEASGVMSIFRQPKFSYDLFRSQREPDELVAGKEAGPVLAIASRLTEEQPGELKVFSNCEEVELFINGSSLGVRKPDRDRISDKLGHPPFTFHLPGGEVHEVIAIARINGKEMARQRLEAPAVAEQIELTADLSGRPLEAGSNDLVFIHARVTDSMGNPVFHYAGKIRFKLKGDGEIIGNAHPAARGGQAAILVRAGRTPGMLTIDAAAEDLNTGLVEVEVQGQN